MKVHKSIQEKNELEGQVVWEDGPWKDEVDREMK
jgi:hypothetical protein